MDHGKLLPPFFVPFTAGEIKPRGWYKRQLRIQADGLAGNLDKIWPDVRDSKWLGGSRDGWERVPYWLDGFIPLAYLLDDDDLKARAKKYIDLILSQQREDGWLCPCGDDERGRYDVWPFFLICKVLALYGDCAKDGRIEAALESAFHCLAKHIQGNTLFNWAAARWFECLIPIFWLYERRGGDWLLDLAFRLEVQGIDYEKLFTFYRDQQARRSWTFLTHVVNIGMCLKAGALAARLRRGNPDAFARDALAKLFEYHGTAAGHFTGDECLAGTSPVQGTELCGVVEAMYSYGVLLSISGDGGWADHLERLAFNALPAAISPDMWTHQYDQMTNQVQCAYLPKDKVVFMTNSGESHLFGLEPNFGCCTANFGQGWPKLALSAFMYRPAAGEHPAEIVSSVLVPSELSFSMGGTPVTCTLDTDYPFRGALRYTIETGEPACFAFSIRIPGWAASATVDGRPARPGTFFTLNREWNGKTGIEVRLEFKTSLAERPGGLYCLWRGPLLYSLAPRERWEKREFTRDGVERKFPYCDYEIFPESPWNYGFYGVPDQAGVIESPVPDRPFSPEHPALRIRATLVPIAWNLVNGVCEERPEGNIAGPPLTADLIPYGCTNLRITEMPLIGEPIPKLG
jgi:hypothetical protein